MGSSSCFESKTIEYIPRGNVITLNFRLETEQSHKKINCHDQNSLRCAIGMYQKEINKEDINIKKAIYEPDQLNLNLDKKLNQLDIDFREQIILYT